MVVLDLLSVAWPLRPGMWGGGGGEYDDCWWASEILEVRCGRGLGFRV